VEVMGPGGPGGPGGPAPGGPGGSGWISWSWWTGRSWDLNSPAPGGGTRWTGRPSLARVGLGDLGGPVGTLVRTGAWRTGWCSWSPVGPGGPGGPGGPWDPVGLSPGGPWRPRTSWGPGRPRVDRHGRRTVQHGSFFYSYDRGGPQWGRAPGMHRTDSAAPEPRCTASAPATRIRMERWTAPPEPPPP